MTSDTGTGTAPVRLAPAAFAAGGAAALAVIFVLCAMLELLGPGLRLSHAWVALFTAAAANSAVAWTEGLLGSAAAGALAGVIVAGVHNRLASRSG